MSDIIWADQEEVRAEQRRKALYVAPAQTGFQVECYQCCQNRAACWTHASGTNKDVPNLKDGTVIAEIHRWNGECVFCGTPFIPTYLAEECPGCGAV